MKFKEDTKLQFDRMVDPRNDAVYHSMVYVDIGEKSDFIVHLDPLNLNKFNYREMNEYIITKTAKTISSLFERAINAIILIKEM